MSYSGTMGAKVIPFTSIPVIDIAPLSGDDRHAFEETAHAIVKAFHEVGFLYAKNHGIPQDLIARAYKQAEMFHHSPVDMKRRVLIDNSPGAAGWLPTSEDEDPDDDIYRLVPGPDNPVDDFLLRKRFFEAFDMWLDIPADDQDFLAGNMMFVPNQWPDWLPGFREDVLEYYDTARSVADTLFRAVAVGLGLPEATFLDNATKPPANFRLLHYPANDLPQTKSNIGMGDHSDENALTLLHQTMPGLQVMNTANEWVEAPPIDGTIVINIGNLMEVWTNGYLKATRHRVANSPHERYSMPYFSTVDYDVVVAPLPQFVTEANPSKYDPIRSGPHFASSVIKFTRHLRKRVLAGELALDFEIEGESIFKRVAVNEFVSRDALHDE